MIKQKLIFSIIFTIILTSLTAQNELNGFDENGERHGIWRKNYPNSYQLRYEGKFNHGKEIDTFKFVVLKCIYFFSMIKFSFVTQLIAIWVIFTPYTVSFSIFIKSIQLILSCKRC